jgi:hypothetical protein
MRDGFSQGSLEILTRYPHRLHFIFARGRRCPQQCLGHLTAERVLGGDHWSTSRNKHLTTGIEGTRLAWRSLRRPLIV